MSGWGWTVLRFIEGWSVLAICWGTLVSTFLGLSAFSHSSNSPSVWEERRGFSTPHSRRCRAPHSALSGRPDTLSPCSQSRTQAHNCVWRPSIQRLSVVPSLENNLSAFHQGRKSQCGMRKGIWEVNCSSSIFSPSPLIQHPIPGCPESQRSLLLKCGDKEPLLA